MFRSIVFYLSLLSSNPAQEVALRQCGDPRWVAPPQVEANVFRGTVRMQCEVRTEGDGDYHQLASRYLESAVASGTVHDGPREATHEALPGTFLDLTVPIGQGGMNWVRSDTYFVTDVERFVGATLSKEISASGLAANVTRIDNAVRVQRTATRGTHRAEVEATVHVRRPALVPTDTFRSLVMSQTEGQVRDRGKETVDFVAANL
jgi:hypothetical protein